MRKSLILLALVAALLVLNGEVFAQQKSTLEKIEERLSSLDKKNDAFNIYLNIQNSANIYLDGSDYKGADFKTNQFRLEMKGEVVKGVRYRFRHRLNRGTSAQNIDNLSRATDIAAISIDLTDNLTVTGGKQCTAFGGYEFDLNPIDIYQYSDMIDYMDNFLTGVDFAYRLNDQEFRFQIVNSRTDHLENLYTGLPESIERSKNPLGYTLNWNGNFMDGKIQTRWSYSIFEEAKDNYMYYVSLGTQFKIDKKTQIQFDWMNSQEDIDRKGIISDLVNQGDEYTRATDVVYNSLIVKIDHKICPKLNLFVKGMYETATNDGNTNEDISNDFRKSYGYIGGIEYFPVKDNLKFYFTYVGRHYDYDQTVTDNLGISDNTTSRFSIGLVYRLKMF